MATPKKENKAKEQNTSAMIPTFSRPILFSQDSVKQLYDSDFELNTKELICLKYEDCIMILFYADNIESTNLTEIWSAAASISVGAIFAACHIGMQRNIASSFAKLREIPSHPLYWARLQGYPFIMVYRRGFPVAFYNSERATQPIIDFSFTLACDSSYTEHENSFLSTEVDKNIQMTGPKSHSPLPSNNTNPPPRRYSSVEYVVSNPLRGYDASFPVIPVTKEEINVNSLQEPTTFSQITIANNSAQTEPQPDIAMPVKPASDVIQRTNPDKI
jgi:hypothetical protein